MKSRSVLITVLLLGGLIPQVFSQQHSYKPKEGYVPDGKTAVRIAEAVLIPIYGEKKIKAEQPFSAKLRNGVWIVTGTIPPGIEGGVAEIRISKSTGTILTVTHGM